MPRLRESFGKFLVTVCDCLKKKRLWTFPKLMKREGVWQQMQSCLTRGGGCRLPSLTDAFKLEVYSWGVWGQIPCPLSTRSAGCRHPEWRNRCSAACVNRGSCLGLNNQPLSVWGENGGQDGVGEGKPLFIEQGQTSPLWSGERKWGVECPGQQLWVRMCPRCETQDTRQD